MFAAPSLNGLLLPMSPNRARARSVGASDMELVESIEASGSRTEAVDFACKSSKNQKMTMKEYYRHRAPEYDQIYRVARRRDELADLRDWLVERIRGRTILEVAAGTGYWTEVAAPVAKAITATDFNLETLAIAESRRLGPHVTFIAADAYELPELPDTFDAGMAMLWWSHVEKQRRAQFLAHFTRRLLPGSVLAMIDQIYVEPFSTPISRQDEWGNLYTLRKLASGASYEIIKNYPSDDELLAAFAGSCDDISVMRTKEFWALSGRVRSRAA
jgi:ubiquinone/menaquinone biosynthesis C-methylase UbiE